VTGVSPFVANSGISPRASWEDYDVKKLQERLGLRKVVGLCERLDGLVSIREKLAKRLELARESQAKFYNRKRKEQYFKVGDLVSLSTKNLSLKSPKKGLAPKFLGPLRVLEPVGTNAYRLALPKGWRIHDVLSVAQLEAWKEPPERLKSETPATPTLPDEVSQEQEWEVEAIVDREWRGKDLYYQVRWQGNWPKNLKETWEPAKNLRNAGEALAEYNSAYPIQNNLSQKAGVKGKKPTRRKSRR
jgi:hypothetical protein